MRGEIYLIRILNKKVVPALCLQEAKDFFLFAQIRMANDEDIFNLQSKADMEKQNKNKPKRDQIKIRRKHEINTIYIRKPKGLKSKSVVMVKKRYKIKQKDIVKKIAAVNEGVVKECFSLIKQVNEMNAWQQELQLLKRKIQIAQFKIHTV